MEEKSRRKARRRFLNEEDQSDICETSCILTTFSVATHVSRKVGVIHVKERLDAGDDPAQIAADYAIDLADVYHALAYYYDNPEEMDAIEERRDKFIASIQNEHTNARRA
jgi:hypothetical protein